MATEKQKHFHAILDPLERFSEIWFWVTVGELMDGLTTGLGG
jgi:hypothetical protein